MENERGLVPQVVTDDGLAPRPQAAAVLRDVLEDWPYGFRPIMGGAPDDEDADDDLTGDLDFSLGDEVEEDDDEDDDSDEDDGDLDLESDAEEDEPERGRRDPESEKVPAWLAAQTPEVQKYIKDLRGKEAKSRVKRREIEQRFQALGGDEYISAAVGVYNLLGTTQGVEQLTRTAAAQLREKAGYTDAKIAELTGLTVADVKKVRETGKAKKLPDGGLDPEQLLERVGQTIDRSIEEKVLAPQRQRQDREMGNMLVSSLISKGYEDKEERDLILQIGNRFVPGGESDDPEVLKAALEQGVKTYEQLIQRKARDFVKARRKKNGDAATPLKSGSSPSGEDTPKFKTVAEASDWLAKTGRI